MSVDVTVIRGDGSREAEDIEEPLVAQSATAARARGSAVLDQAASRRVSTHATPYHGGLSARQLIEIDDPTYGPPVRGRVARITRTASAAEGGRMSEMQITVERPK